MTRHAWLAPWTLLCLTAWPLEAWRYWALIGCAVAAMILYARTD
jgi:hypothetical protein